MALFINFTLIAKYVLVEIPATTLSLVVINVPYNERLGDVVQDYVSVSSVILSAVFMTLASLYIYLACSKNLPSVTSSWLHWYLTYVSRIIWSQCYDRSKAHLGLFIWWNRIYISALFGQYGDLVCKYDIPQIIHCNRTVHPARHKSTR